MGGLVECGHSIKPGEGEGRTGGREPPIRSGRRRQPGLRGRGEGGEGQV